MHFFSPAHIMKLVEIIRGLKTSDETVEVIRNLMRRSEGRRRGQDGPGFCESHQCGLAERGLQLPCGRGCQIEDIDKAMKFGLGHLMGPLELQDLVGLT